MGYVKLLAELDLLKDASASSTKSEDDDEDEASIYDTLSLNSLEGSRGSLDELKRTGAGEDEGGGNEADEQRGKTDLDNVGDVTLTEETVAKSASVKRHRRYVLVHKRWKLSSLRSIKK